LALTTFPQAPTINPAQSFNQTTAVAIPTGPAVISSTLAVSGVTSRICKAVLRTGISHTFNQDLDITLTSPSGTVVTVSTDNGSGSGLDDNAFNGTVWDDDANPAGQVPYTANNGVVTDHTYANLVLASPLVVEESMGAFMGEDANGTWTLTISDDFSGDGGNLANWGLDLVTCQCPGDLTLAITDTPDPVTPGTNVTYVATSTNNGPGPVSDVNISVPLAAGTLFVSSTPSAGGVCTTPAVGANGTVSCNFAGTTASAGTNSVTVIASVPASTAPGGTLTVNATTASTPPDLNTANNGATASTVVGAASADLAAGLTDSPDPVTAGTNLTYTATVANLGPSDAQNAQISLPLPAGTTLVSSNAPGGTCSGTTTIVCVWSGATAPSVTRTATIVALVGAGVASNSTLTATNTVSSASADPVSNNNAATTTTTVNASANLALTLTASTLDTPLNTPVTFTAVSTNLGPSDAQNLSISLVLSPDFRFGTVTATGATCTTPQIGLTGTITCTWAGATAPNASRTMDVTAVAVVDGITTISASTVSGTSDPVNTNNNASLSMRAGLPYAAIPVNQPLALALLALLIGGLGLALIRRQG
jgi:uncharacterized repeat protein (TIGR01451 family)